MGSQPTGEAQNRLRASNREFFREAKSLLKKEGKEFGRVDVTRDHDLEHEAFLTKGGTLISVIKDEQGFKNLEDSIFQGSAIIGTNESGTIFSAGADHHRLSDEDIREIFQPGADVSSNLRRGVQLATLGHESRRTGAFQTDFNKIVSQEQEKAQTRVDREFHQKEAKIREAFGGSRVRPKSKTKKKKTPEEIEKDKNIRASFSGGLGTNLTGATTTTSKLASPTLLGE